MQAACSTSAEFYDAQYSSTLAMLEETADEAFKVYMVKADIPCSLGGGRRGFDPRVRSNDNSDAQNLLSAVGDLK